MIVFCIPTYVEGSLIAKFFWLAQRDFKFSQPCQQKHDPENVDSRPIAIPSEIVTVDLFEAGVLPPYYSNAHHHDGSLATSGR